MRASFWWVCNLSLSVPQRGYASYYNLKVHYAVQRTVHLKSRMEVPRICSRRCWRSASDTPSTWRRKAV